MSDIYVTGHKNPDTDSIVAAISYAALRNALGDREYKAVRIGGINDETANILQRFHMEPPEYVKNMRTQVADLDFDHPPELNASVTMDLAWRTMREHEIATLPILKEDGTLFGILSAGDIASYDMQAVYNSHISGLPLFNLLSVIEGRIVNDLFSRTESVSGDVVIAVPSAFGKPDFSGNPIVICGNDPTLAQEAVSAGVSCLILCQADVPAAWSSLDCRTCIISSPLDVRTVSRVIYQAMPVSSVCNCNQNIICFRLTDYLDDVKEVLLKTRFRCYPVLDREGKVKGTLSRYHLLQPRRKKVVLVDHNEAAQSVTGLEQVEILEIIDHHRLADIQTSQPVSVRNEPVGSTNTILTSMYQEFGVVPSPKIAGLMASAILSDTVMFKSPTSTSKDRIMAERLAKIADVSLEELGRELFSNSSAADKPAEELLKSDYKKFHISGQNLGVGQITCIDSSVFIARKQEFLDVMNTVRKQQELDYVILMLTDVLSEGSYLFYYGNDDVIAQAFNCMPEDNQVFLPGVMSRKKQVIPMLTALWG